MDIQKYLKEMKDIQQDILTFLENEENSEENFQNLNQLFEDIKIRDDQHIFRLFLRCISEISNNHHHVPNFFPKIERIILIFKEDIKRNITNSRIFDIFKANKRILLFLFEEGIIIMDKYVLESIATFENLDAHFSEYFTPEIKTFLKGKPPPKYSRCLEELPDNFYELRRIGENENHICNLIRNDSIKDFISYVNCNNISLDLIIENSLYETDPFINSLKSYKFQITSLIDYAAFFGSIQIFNYLRINGAKLSNSLWNYAIHGCNAEIIHFLEESNIKPSEHYKTLLEKSIKCHHNDIANYFVYNYLQEKDEKDLDILSTSLKYYNFYFIPKNQINESSFYYLCQYDYYSIVELLLTSKDIDVNQKKIHNFYF